MNCSDDVDEGPQQRQSSARKKYYGKYRATVVANVDPKKKGRIKVQVTDVGGAVPATWALPCVPFAGPGMGFYTVPPLKAQVWIEFEQGNPDFPIWVGCHWASALELPALGKLATPLVDTVAMQTTKQTTIAMSDVPIPPNGGNIVLQTVKSSIAISDAFIQIKCGATSIMITDAGIVMTNGGADITMVGNTTTINKTALTIT